MSKIAIPKGTPETMNKLMKILIKSSMIMNKHEHNNKKLQKKRF